jgi:hypothetical protein
MASVSPGLKEAILVSDKSKVFLVTVILAAAGAVLSVGLAVGASLYLSVYEAQQGSQRLCNAFGYFIHQPVPPDNTLAKHLQQEQYAKLLTFESKLGCHK